MNNTPLTEGDDTEEASSEETLQAHLKQIPRNNSPAVKRKPFANDDLLTDWRKAGPVKKKKEKEILSEHKEKGKVRTFLHGRKEEKETKKKEKSEKPDKATEKVEKPEKNDKKEDMEFKKKAPKQKKTSTKSRYNNITSRSKWNSTM